MKNTQSTLFGEEKPFISRNKKIIKSKGVKFYPATVETPDGIIDEIENVYHRSKFYSLTSGGKDSVSLTHWLDIIGKLEAVVHIKTNIGLESTTDFVYDLCQEHGWKLYVIEPSPKFTYASHVLQYGFPLAGFHNLIMGKLKYKTMRDFALTINREEHCLISGVRKFESVRRMGNYPYPILSDSALWFACPFFYKTSEETYRYIHENGLKIAPAYSLGLGTSGECMCGSFAVKNEKELIRKLDPKLAEYIKWLEDGVEKFGTKQAKKYPLWGGQPKITELEKQQELDGFFKDNPDLIDVNDTESIVCGQECGAGSMRGMLDY